MQEVYNDQDTGTKPLKSFSNKLKTLESKPKSSANINDALQFRFNKPKSIKSDDWDDGDGFHTIKHYNKDNYQQNYNKRNSTQHNNKNNHSNSNRISERNSSNLYQDKVRAEERRDIKGMGWDKISNTNDAIMDRINGRGTSENVLSQGIENGYTNGSSNGYHHDKIQKQNYDPVDALQDAPDHIIDNIENWLPDLASNKSQKEIDNDNDDLDQDQNNNDINENKNVFKQHEDLNENEQEYTFVNDNFDLLNDDQIMSTSNSKLLEGFKISNEEFKENITIRDAQFKDGKDGKEAKEGSTYGHAYMTNYLIAKEDIKSNTNGTLKNNTNGITAKQRKSSKSSNDAKLNDVTNVKLINICSNTKECTEDQLEIIDMVKNYSQFLLENQDVKKIIKVQAQIRIVNKRISDYFAEDDQ